MKIKNWYRKQKQLSNIRRIDLSSNG